MPHQRTDDAGQHIGVGTRRNRALLSTAQLGCGNHLHCLGDLARAFYTANAPAQIENVGHGYAVFFSSAFFFSSSESAFTDDSFSFASRCSATKFALYSSRADLMRFFKSSSNDFLVAISFSNADCAESRYG